MGAASNFGLTRSIRWSMLLSMSAVNEIKTAIGTLSSQERAELERWLREQAAQPSSPSGIRLPDQAARRRRILGDKVLPNLVLEARHAEPQ